MPSGGRSGWSSNARGRTSTLAGGSSASAWRRRWWPRKHHGHETSAHTSTGMAELAMVSVRYIRRARCRRAHRGGFPRGRRGRFRRVKLLVLATQPVDADRLRGALPGDDLEGAEVLVVSPAVNESAVAFWMSDSDEAIAEAESAAAQTAAALRESGAQARATTGESEPLLALQDALATFPADRVVFFVRGEDAARYREDDVVGEAERRFGVPVTEVAG